MEHLPVIRLIKYFIKFIKHVIPLNEALDKEVTK
jgi:hypothetical protein